MSDVGAPVELDEIGTAEEIQAALMAHYLETDDPIIWRLIEG